MCNFSPKREVSIYCRLNQVPYSLLVLFLLIWFIMRGVKMKTISPTTKGLVELNHHVRDKHKTVRDVEVGCEGQGHSEGDEPRFNEDTEDVNSRAHPVLPRPQTQPQVSQGQVIRWERILPFRSLKVLLVENDDSTRHVVTALLRNCCYEVTAVQNGLEAWQILEDSTSHIDLVLTEVVMPCLSGIRLLCKIMSHKTCKNIPVIMMSSNDSMGIAFKCLSKGAVDFLVKPIRKNELKNLWQHVWRKCHSSGGSGSENGAWTQKPTKLISDEGSDNNIGSKDEDDNGSVGSGTRDGSDNGSGTQSSWTRRAVEGDSSIQMSPREQLGDPPVSTCAQVICSKPEAFTYNWVPTNATKECQEQNDQLDNSAMGKDLEIGVPRNPDLQLEDQTDKVLTSVAASNEDKFTDLDSKRDAEKLEKGNMELNSETPHRELRNKATNLTGVITKIANAQVQSVAIEIPNYISKTSKEMPFLELSLKRQNNVGVTGTSLLKQNVLRHSDLSAFSRYTTTSHANQAPTENVGSCSTLDNSSEASKREPIPNLQSNSNGTPTQRSNGSSNKYDMGSTTNNVFNNLHSCSPLQQGQNGHMSSLQPVIPEKTGAEKVNTVLAQGSGMNQQVQVQHHHHHYHHHHHHHVHNTKQNGQPPNHYDLSLINTVASPHCGPSNALHTPVEGNTANYYSLNESTSGSNNGQNGDNNAVNFRGTNMASENGIAGKCGAGGESGSVSGSGVEQHQFSHREAALNKFRQKRKDRCFEKKVRYQSRKKLAEQRPRVRGQFMRQVMHANKSKDTNC